MKTDKLNVDAVIFDLDGTIIDSMKVYYMIVDTTLDRVGLPGVSRDLMREAAKDGDFKWSMLLPENLDGRKRDVLRQIMAVSREVYTPLFERHLTLLPGAEAAVQELHSRGFKLGIVTSTPRSSLDFKLGYLNSTRPLFESIIASDDTPDIKPSPIPILECCRQLRVRPENSIYVGDFRTDIQAGKAAGTWTIGVLTGFDNHDALDREGPDRIVDSICDLVNVLEAISK